VLWRGRIAPEFLVVRDPVTGKKTFKCIELNNQRGAVKDYNDIPGLNHLQRLFTDIASAPNPDTADKHARFVQILSELDDGSFISGLDKDSENQIKEYLIGIAFSLPLMKNLNRNPRKLEDLFWSKSNSMKYVDEKDKVKSWTISELFTTTTPPVFLIVKPDDGIQGRNIEIIPYSRVKEAKEVIDRMVSGDEKITREEVLKADKVLSLIKNNFVQTFEDGTSSANVPERLKKHKCVIRYAVDFTLTKSGKIYIEFLRPYVSVIKRPRVLDRGVPSYYTEVLNIDTEVEVFSLTPDELKELEIIVRRIIENLSKNKALFT
jgi:hypothetical protein